MYVRFCMLVCWYVQTSIYMKFYMRLVICTYIHTGVVLLCSSTVDTRFPDQMMVYAYVVHTYLPVVSCMIMQLLLYTRTLSAGYSICADIIDDPTCRRRRILYIGRRWWWWWWWWWWW